MPKSQEFFARFFLLTFLFFTGLTFLSVSWLTSDGGSVQSPEDEGIVVAVYDGDTLMVEFVGGRAQKVRLIGLDAPETDHPLEKVQLMAQLSKRFAFYFLYGERIKLTYDFQYEDKYGRLLAYVWTEENGLFNEFIISEGFASAYLKFPFKDTFRKRFIQAERQARSSNRGLWNTEPYPEVLSTEAARHVGQTAAVKFRCHQVVSRGKFVYLSCFEGQFTALVPEERVRLFRDLESLEGRTISVKGFVEDYRGQPQMMLFFPSQIIAKDRD